MLVPAGFPRTAEALSVFGRPVLELDVSDVAMMDGGLSCLSLRF